MSTWSMSAFFQLATVASRWRLAWSVTSSRVTASMLPSSGETTTTDDTPVGRPVPMHPSKPRPIIKAEPNSNRCFTGGPFRSGRGDLVAEPELEGAAGDAVVPGGAEIGRAGGGVAVQVVDLRRPAGVGIGPDRDLVLRVVAQVGERDRARELGLA